jgi:cell division protein ZapA (FtsZ GTPase activity inhibitor)
MRRNVTVVIAGQRYNLRSDAQDKDDKRVHDLAAYVDARMREVQKASRSPDTQALAVLAALQVAEELFSERRAHAELKKKVKERSESLLQLLAREARV